MATPAYLGQGQPPVDSDSGWLTRLGSFFGGATPQYYGNGQPSLSGGFLGGATPAYVSALASAPATNIVSANACASCPIDPAALAAGNIAIVIPRDRGGACRDDVAATD